MLKKLNFNLKGFIALLIFCSAILYGIFEFSFYPHDWFLKHPSSHKDLVIHKNFNHFFLCTKSYYPLLQPYEKDFEKLLKNKIANLRKHKHRSVCLVRLNGKDYVLKQFTIASFKDWLKCVPFRSSSAYRIWHYSNLLPKHGIQTPKAIALYEKKIGPFWTQNYVITEYIEEAQLLISLDFKEKENRKKFIPKVQKQIDTLSALQLIHTDYGCRNIIAGKDQLFLIDLEDLHHYKKNNFFFRYRTLKKHIERIKSQIPFFDENDE